MMIQTNIDTPTQLKKTITDYSGAIDYDFYNRSAGVFLEYQKQWVADKSNVKLAEKSRRIGFTWAEAADNVLTAAANSGMDVWYIGYNKEMAIEYILDCAQWARHFDMAVSDIEVGEEVFEGGRDDKAVLTFSIKFASGHRITALSSSPSNLRGKQGLVVIDEAAFHPNLKELLKAAFALLIWGGAVHIMSTHNGVDNYFNELIQEIKAGKKPYSLHKTTFKEAIKHGLYSRICMRTKEKYSKEGEEAWEKRIRAIYHPNDSEELDCIPSQSTGAYFSRALVEARLSSDYPILKLDLPDGFELKSEIERQSRVQYWLDDHVKLHIESIPVNLRTYYGMDFARSSDLSVIMPAALESKAKYYTPFILEMRNVPFDQQRQVLFYICDLMPNFQGGANDSRGNGQYLGEVAMQRYGAGRILQVMITQQWYRDNMPKYKASFEDAEITMAYGEEVIDDHRTVQLVNGIPSVPNNLRTTDKSGNKRHGDTAIAGCMLVHAIHNCGGEFNFMSTSPRTFSSSSTDLQGFINHG